MRRRLHRVRVATDRFLHRTMGKILEFATNHPLLASGTILMLLAVIFYELRQKASGLAALSAVQAVRFINQGARVVDIRGQEKYTAGHIVDAINVPEDDLLDKVEQKLKNAKSIIIVCDTGMRSGQAVAALRRSGHSNTFNLQGGLAGWQNENLPVVTSS